MSEPDHLTREPAAVADRYAQRQRLIDSGRYSPLNPSVYMATQELERALVRLVGAVGLEPLADKRVLEVGCGDGGNLLQLLRLGCQPENLVGNELLPDRLATARRRLPAALQLLPGDASTLDLAPASFDIVLQSTVFTSLLDEGFRDTLAARMWQWVKPGGGVLWYDFHYDNPRNAHVRGVPLRRIRSLFPAGRIRAWRVTLAPPLSRRLCRLHPALYGLCNLPPLRTHLLCWIAKP